MNPIPGMTVALTGATGFLGSHIADALLAGGHQVRASVRPTSNKRWLEGKALELLETDLEDADSCGRLVDGVEAVIHCAGVVSAGREDQYFQGNVETTRVLLEAAEKSGAKIFILISSLAAHGPAGLDKPATEEAPCHPITAYGRSKEAAEKLVNDERWSFRTVIVRPPGLYGPRDEDFLPLFKAAAKGITARIGRTMSGLSLVDGRDAAAAAVSLLECDSARGTFFVDDGHCGYDWQELAGVLSVTMQRRVRLLTIPLGLLKALSALVSAVAGPGRAARSPVLNPDRIRDLDTCGWVCDGTHLRQVTGFKARFDLTHGFAETVQDMKEYGLL